MFAVFLDEDVGETMDLGNVAGGGHEGQEGRTGDSGPNAVRDKSGSGCDGK